MRKRNNTKTRDTQFLNTTEISEITGVSVNTVRGWIERGELPAHRLGRNFRIQEHDFEAFLDASREPAGPPNTAA